MDDDGYNLNLERSKVLHGKFRGVHKGRWVGLECIEFQGNYQCNKLKQERWFQLGYYMQRKN